MSDMQGVSNSEANAGLNEVHRFGSASESMFRRLYRGLNRRQQFEDELRRQRALAGREASRHASACSSAYQQLQGEHHGRRSSEMERLRAVLGSLDEGIIAQDHHAAKSQ